MLLSVVARSVRARSGVSGGGGVSVVWFGVRPRLGPVAALVCGHYHRGAYWLASVVAAHTIKDFGWWGPWDVEPSLGKDGVGTLRGSWMVVSCTRLTIFTLQRVAGVTG